MNVYKTIPVIFFSASCTNNFFLIKRFQAKLMPKGCVHPYKIITGKKIINVFFLIKQLAYKLLIIKMDFLFSFNCNSLFFHLYSVQMFWEIFVDMLEITSGLTPKFNTIRYVRQQQLACTRVVNPGHPR